MPDLSLESIDEDVSLSEMAEDEIDVVAEAMRGEEGRYDTLDVIVHPGYTRKRGSWETYEFLDEGMYDEYREEFESYLDDVEGEVAVLYPMPEYEESVEETEGLDATYIGTHPNSGVLHPDERERFGSILADLEEGGEVRVSGELNGVCLDHVAGLIHQAVDDAGRDLHVEEHVTFPKGKIGELYGKRYLTEVDDEYGSGPSLGESVRSLVPFTG